MSVEIRDMFASIAPRYDVANDVLSMGIHRLWRRRLVSLAKKEPAAAILDLCTGTGDLAFAFARAFGPSTKVVGLDFVPEMVELATRKSQNFPSDQITFLQGDATSIPFPPQSFDIVSVAFGVRNIPQRENCLAEVRRVLKPNGRFFVLEFGQMLTPGIKQAYEWYGKAVMPLIGRLITGNRAAYEYLPETSRHFPAGPAFAEILANNGFRNPASESLLGGLAYIYQARAAEIGAASIGQRAHLG
jgi:demethylmenaquinone methyltransferase/2-methoxy-6-polyprenyl-1,4-benzoquinol methylase